ncbi:FxSxx-COOH system tetratricopeptide repeat protein [Actinomadura geliboluensis]|uniref:FxSxx-COOH system tetratricopeptide repeat protein n=1 Tax=Actinomadura geliboluensis TaxID=882440 RepID=UPI0037233B1F
MGMPVWLDFADKFASVIGATAGILGLVIASSQRRRGDDDGDGPRRPASAWSVWLRTAAVFGACSLIVLAVRALGLTPRSWDWPVSAIAGAVSALACAAAVMAWLSFRRQSMPLPAALRLLLTEQWQDARGHQYEYFVGEAPPLPEIYVEQKTEAVPQPGRAEAQLFTIREMLLAHRSTVVVAEPGVGKSTAVALVLREQCRWWLDASRSDDAGDAPYGSVLPVSVPAELLADRSVSEALAAHCRQVTGRSVGAELFDDRPPNAESWLVVVDGLDQVLSSRRRARVLARLGDAVTASAEHRRFMITTRPLMLGELGNLSGEHITRFALRGFERRDLYAFAERWVAHRNRTHSPGLEAPPITLERFVAAVSSSRLSAIARVPLIATITALILETDQDDALPTSRAGLYERFIQHLLNARRVRADEEEGTAADLARQGPRGGRAWDWLSDNLRDLLEGTADLCLSQGGTQVAASAAAWVRGHAPPDLFDGLPGWEVSVRGLLTSTSLIVPRTGGLRFAHPSIAEYLAAGPRAREFDRASWLADARSPDGRNLALFTLARSAHSADPLVTLLMERGGADTCVAGEIIADGIPVGAHLRAEVVDRLFDQLVRDDRSAPEALEVLVKLTSDEQVTDRLTALATGDGGSPWVRAFTAEALCAVLPDGSAILRTALRESDADEIRRWLLERLVLRGAATEQERETLASLAPATISAAVGGAMAAQWYRQITEDADADPGQRLRALLALADGGYAETVRCLEDVIVLPALTAEARLDAARAILQAGLAGVPEVLRRVGGGEGRDLDVRVPVLAALAGGGDAEARVLLDALSSAGGEEFAARFPSLALWSETSGMRSTERQAGRNPRVWGRIPPRNPYFSGRDDELAELRRRLAGGDTTQVLHGLGGVGKTQLAIEYAYRFRDDYDMVWWIPSDQPSLIRGNLARLGAYIGARQAADVGTDAAITSVLHALQTGSPYDRWLLIFDNCDQPDELHHLLPSGPGHVLVTSRNIGWGPGTAGLAIDVFSRPESLAFLRRRIPGLDETTGDALADYLGDLATSLENAAGLLAETGRSAEDYLAELENQADARLRNGLPTEYPVSLVASMESALKQVFEEDVLAAILLRHCAHFGPEPIPFDVLYTAHRVVVGMESLADPLRFLETVSRLRRYGLITVDTPGRKIQANRLVAALVRDGVPRDERQHVQHHVHLMLAAGASDPDAPEARDQYSELAGHIYPTRMLECPHPDVRSFILNCARFFALTGDHASCRSLMDRAVSAWEEDLGEAEPLMRQAQLLRARAHRALGDFASALRIAHDVWEAVPEARPEEKSSAARSLGVGLRLTGDFGRALDLDRRAAATAEELFGDTGEQTIGAALHLALDHELAGDYDSAHRTYAQAAQALLGRRSARRWALAAMALSGAARASTLAGDYGAGRLLSGEARAVSLSSTVGNTVKAMVGRDAAVILRLMGSERDAPRSGPEQALEILTDIGTRHDPSGVDDLVFQLSLGNTLLAAGRPDEATDQLGATLRKITEVLGEQHPFTYAAQSNLAAACRLDGAGSGSASMNHAAHHGLSQSVGPDHPYTLTCAVNLAGDHAAQGDLEAAAALGRTTLTALRARLGERHPLTLAGAVNLSTDLRRLGDPDAAAMRDQALHHLAATADDIRPDAIDARRGRRLTPTIELPPLTDTDQL